MKTCAFCGAANQDESPHCIQCNRDLSTQTAPTQPVRILPPVLPEASPPFLPEDTSPVQTGTSPQVQSGTSPYVPPFQPLLDEPNPPVEPPPPAQDLFPGRFWPILTFSLAGVFLCVCVLVALTLSTLNGSRRLAAQLPTPWPTLAPQARPIPTFPPAPTPALPSPTQLAEVKKLLSPECAGALDQLGSFSSQVSSQPTILLDANWRTGFTRSISAMRSSCGSLDSASPVPSQVSGVQRSLSRASTEFDQATQLFSEGVHNWSPSQLLQAGQHIQQATRDLNQAIQELHQIGQ
jgi:hypothetical protein